jgi:hypothetical protein
LAAAGADGSADSGRASRRASAASQDEVRRRELDSVIDPRLELVRGQDSKRNGWREALSLHHGVDVGRQATDTVRDHADATDHRPGHARPGQSAREGLERRF